MAGDGDAGGPTTEWECPHCTLLNDDASSMCAVCSNPRPRGDDADEAARGQEEQPGGAAPDGMWCCGVCTYHNAAFSARCVICSQVREAPRDPRVSSRGSREPRPSRAPTSPPARARAPSPIPRRDRPTSRFRAQIPHPGAHLAPPLGPRPRAFRRVFSSYRAGTNRIAIPSDVGAPRSPPLTSPARPLPLSRASPPRRASDPSTSPDRARRIPPTRSRRYSPTRPPRPPRSRRNSASCAPTSSPSRSAARCSADEAIGSWWSVSPPDSRRWPPPNPRRRRRLRQPRAEAAGMAPWVARGVHGVPAAVPVGPRGKTRTGSRRVALRRAQLSRRLATTSSSSSCAARFGRTRR